MRAFFIPKGIDMSQYVNLVGTEEVSRAGYVMRDAASEMQRAASTIHESNYQLIQALQEHQRVMLMVLEAKSSDPLGV